MNSTSASVRGRSSSASLSSICACRFSESSCTMSSRCASGSAARTELRYFSRIGEVMVILPAEDFQCDETEVARLQQNLERKGNRRANRRQQRRTCNDGQSRQYERE